MPEAYFPSGAALKGCLACVLSQVGIMSLNDFSCCMEIKLCQTCIEGMYVKEPIRDGLFVSGLVLRQA